MKILTCKFLKKLNISLLNLYNLKKNNLYIKINLNNFYNSHNYWLY